MDLYLKAETERLAQFERSRRRQLRIAQVRQQTSDWTSKSREEFKAEKDRQMKRFSDTIVVDVQNDAAEQIKYHAQAHSLALSEIGAAHRAAANIPDFKSMADRQKMIDEKIAQKRFVEAVKQNKTADSAKQRKQEEPLRRKAQVRFEEDNKSKRLVEKLPFGIKNTEDVGKDSSLRNPEYQQSLAKFLHVPSSAPEKENKSVVRSKPGRSKTEKKVPEPTPAPPKGIFARIAEVRQAGATTPDLTEAQVLPPRVPHARRHRKPGPDVTYYDASIPQPPRKYRPPSGLVERIPRRSSEPTAWTEAKQIDSELLKMKIRKSLEAIEKQKVAEERGKRALKIAKLEQEFKQLEAEFIKSVGPETPALTPVLYSPIKKSLVDLEEIVHSRLDLDRTQNSSRSMFDQLDDIGPPSALDWTTESERLDSTIGSRPPPRYDNDEFFRNIGNILKSDSCPSILNDESFHNIESTLSSDSNQNISYDESSGNIENVVSTGPIRTIKAPPARTSTSTSSTDNEPFQDIESSLSSISATTVSAPATQATRHSTSASNEEFCGDVETILSSSSAASLTLPATSTPNSHQSSMVNDSSLFKGYIKRLLEHRRESIDEMSSPSTDSLIVISSSASICSFSTILSPKNLTSSSSETREENSGTDQVDNMSSDMTELSEQLSQTLIQTDEPDDTLITESTSSYSSTEAIVTFRMTPRRNKITGELSQDSSSSSTDESLKSTLSTLCLRQQFALHIAPIQSDSNSSTYYSADERNIGVLRAGSSGSLFRTARIEPPGQELVPFPYNQPQQESGDEFASNESFRGNSENPMPVNISRPSPDLQISLENNPFQQLTNEWANITIERPPWL